MLSNEANEEFSVVQMIGLYEHSSNISSHLSVFF